MTDPNPYDPPAGTDDRPKRRRLVWYAFAFIVVVSIWVVGIMAIVQDESVVVPIDEGYEVLFG